MDETALRRLTAADEFHLGGLPTEARHPLTGDLADLARRDLPQALRILKQIDCAAIERVLENAPAVAPLSDRMQECLRSKRRIFLYGCGATGRLSLSLEYLWRFTHPATEAVRGFMSGGDLALVHSLEDFEDRPDYGARQLNESGFEAGDLLVSCTEGGETPSVIGATEAAAASARRKPWFLYCNPSDVLRALVERSRRVLDDDRIEKLELYVGPMALSGSTRLQASTALMLAAGWALLETEPSALLDFLRELDTGFLAPFVEAEAAIYARGESVLYETNHYGITILTDTTERAPTFSVPGFENRQDPGRRPSPCFLCLGDAGDAPSAWRRILLREPITLEWPELKSVAGHERLMGFDFSRKAREHRQALRQHEFVIDRRGDNLVMQLGDAKASLDVSRLHPLLEHLLLKILLNTHSTLVMGRLGRYESNLMTWVRPSNLKLIDRAIRYSSALLEREGVHAPYARIARQCLLEMETLGPDESIVLKTVAALR